MQALVFTAPNEMQFREEPAPELDRNATCEEVIVKVAHCGICGSDMHAYHGHDMVRRPPPLILGHEAAGTIVDGPRSGERVAINPLMSCGTCIDCQRGEPHLCSERRLLSMKGSPGAFAEYVRVRAENCLALPDGMPTEVAALTEPMAVCNHAVSLGERWMRRPLSEAYAVVVGGGAIGLGTALALAARGVRDIAIAETSGLRRERLSSFGPFVAYDPAAQNGAPDDSSADLVFDAFGSGRSRAEASRVVRPGGAIVHIGLAGGDDGIDVRKLTLQEVGFLGTYCYTPADVRETLDGLAKGRYGDLSWTEQRPLAEGAESFQDLDGGQVASAKIVLAME
ncbi:MAG: alcohol dehydrogenase catalytic domain-containing protein [Pseudomonadota bacterium]